LKVDKFGIVNVLGFNSPEWFVANMGSIMGGGICAGIYTTNTAEACEYISQHSKAAVVVVEDHKQLAKYASMAKGSLPHLKALVVWGEASLDKSIASKCAAPVYLWADFLALGANSSVTEEAIDTRLQSILPGHCSTLIYTSGTTGPPKAVMISHDNITWTAKVMKDNYVDLGHNDRICSYLPLSHIGTF
jgi:long-chain-fatty-acid--CoA ligase ACSBG